MTLTDEDIREILRIIDESPLNELRIETEDFSLHVRKGAEAQTSDVAAGDAPEPGAHPRDSDPPRPDRDEALTIEAPMLGIFYRAEAPGQEPFVEVGSPIEPGTTVGIIEVMKMMNSVVAGVAGTIVAVCSPDGELVEYGQPLFRVKPTAS